MNECRLGVRRTEGEETYEASTLVVQLVLATFFSVLTVHGWMKCVELSRVELSVVLCCA